MSTSAQTPTIRAGPNRRRILRIALNLTDAGGIRFGFSELVETVPSLRTVGTEPASPSHAPWVRTVRPLLGDVDMAVLHAVVRPAGYIPGFLLDLPADRAGWETGFDAGLARVVDTDPEVVATQLRHLYQHAIARSGSGTAPRHAVLRGLADDPVAAIRRIAADLGRYRRVAIEPHWARIRAVLRADVSYRLDELAVGGLRCLFRTLHPSVALRRDTLEVAKDWSGTVEAGPHGLLLVPCVFGWPDVIVRGTEPRPTVTYAPRGLGRLWESAAGLRATTRRTALADLVGPSRAAVLIQLDFPMTTTQLACLLDLTPPTLSAHLKTLEAGPRPEGG